MTEPKRQFRGFWLPVELLNDKRLGATEKLLLAEIDALCGEEDEGCWASNAHLGNKVGISAKRAHNIITKLRKLGYVETVRTDGRMRWLRAYLKGGQSARKRAGRVPENGASSLPENGHKDTSIDTSIETNQAKARKRAEWEAHAAKIYAAYPLKAKRPRAIAAIVKHLRAGVPYEVLLRKTEAFAMARAGNLDYCPHPATWFNGEAFNDDPATWVRAKEDKAKGGPDYSRMDTNALQHLRTKLKNSVSEHRKGNPEYDRVLPVLMAIKTELTKRGKGHLYSLTTY